MTLVNGAAFALDTPSGVQAVWGAGTAVLWSAGEPFLLVGPQGVGKSTVAQQIAFARLGIGGPDVLGLPVATDDQRVLYVAADRPRQTARSMRRMVGPEHRELLSERLVVWTGPLPFRIVDHPERLAAFATEHGAGTVVLDGLKDVASPLSEEKVGTAVNEALQALVRAGIEVLAQHHQRKGSSDNRAPRTLADVYGSTWITAGAGSVALIWGDAGDLSVELTHLKPPADEVGPLAVLHDHHAGRSWVAERVQAIDLLDDDPVTVKTVACRLFAAMSPSRNQVEKARRNWMSSSATSARRNSRRNQGRR